MLRVSIQRVEAAAAVDWPQTQLVAAFPDHQCGVEVDGGIDVPWDEKYGFTHFETRAWLDRESGVLVRETEHA
jgi:hypothetical protein